MSYSQIMSRFSFIMSVVLIITFAFFSDWNIQNFILFSVGQFGIAVVYVWTYKALKSMGD